MALGLALYTQPSFAQKPKPDYKKNSVQIGKTGYYFDQENPFGFGRVLIRHIPETKQILFYLPYLSYTRKITRSFGFKASMERFGACYECKYYGKRWPAIPVFVIATRAFKILQVNALYELSVSERLKLTLSGGGGYRWSEVGELWNTAYIENGLWRESIGSGKPFHEWGVGGAFEIKYKFYKNFSLSAKGEYFSFPKRPVRHWGAGAYIGYDF